ncbi:MAG: amidohydrolase [Planctomycetes bacterium]|nr:amidohydrolase [Planctomycetota bacterium]
MSRSLLVPAALCTALLAALCTLSPARSARSEPQATLYHGGRIVVNDGRGTVAEALLERDGLVVATGTLAQLSARPEAAGAARVDLRGACAVPGLQDAHAHLEGYAAALEDVDLSGAASYAEVVARVVARARTLPEGTWVRGRGWDQNLWAEKEFPHHRQLSDATPRHPVLLERVDGHAALANESALLLAGLGGVRDPERTVAGGRVFLDEEQRATGVLLDAATALVERVIPKPPAEVLERRFLAAQERLVALGLTCVHDMGTSRPMLTLLEELRERGLLKLRVVAYLDGQGPLDAKALQGFPKRPDSRDMLSVPGVKLYADGALGSRGAALLEPYSDAPGERGLLLTSEADLATRLSLVARAGLQPAVHAIGDRANRIVLDAYARLTVAVPGFRDLRPRIEHAQVVAPKDWERFPALGVVPSMQPTHATSDMAWVVDRLGPERTRGAYAWRALAPELGRLAFGSDFPVESPDPLLGLFAARTRTKAGAANGDSPLPDHRLDGAAALAGFTSGAAWAARQDDRRGRLLPGFACDLSVFGLDPTTCDPAELLKDRARMTVVNGRVVWRAPEPARDPRGG